MRTPNVARLLNTRGQLWRQTSTPDGGGGTSRTWALAHDRVRARISQPSARERERGERFGAELTHQIYFLPTTDVRRGDEYRGADGRRFEVLAVFGPSVAVYTRADVRVHQAEGAA